MASTACKFSHFFRGSMPSDPLESFLLLKLLKIDSAKKITLKKVSKIGTSSQKKIPNTPLT